VANTLSRALSSPAFFHPQVFSSPDVFISGIFHLLASTVRGLTIRGRPTIIAT
jgi:hypothetical protein